MSLRHLVGACAAAVTLSVGAAAASTQQLQFTEFEYAYYMANLHLDNCDIGQGAGSGCAGDVIVNPDPLSYTRKFTLNLQYDGLDPAPAAGLTQEIGWRVDEGAVGADADFWSSVQFANSLSNSLLLTLTFDADQNILDWSGYKGFVNNRSRFNYSSAGQTRPYFAGMTVYDNQVPLTEVQLYSTRPGYWLLEDRRYSCFGEMDPLTAAPRPETCTWPQPHVAAVPLPASVTLMLASLGALGVWRVRRRTQDI